jgi:hypothetical protein
VASHPWSLPRAGIRAKHRSEDIKPLALGALSRSDGTPRSYSNAFSRRSRTQMGYRACQRIIQLAEEYSATHMEAAADRALKTDACRYRSVKSILKNSLRSASTQPTAFAYVIPAPGHMGLIHPKLRHDPD